MNIFSKNKIILISYSALVFVAIFSIFFINHTQAYVPVMEDSYSFENEIITRMRSFVGSLAGAFDKTWKIAEDTSKNMWEDFKNDILHDLSNDIVSWIQEPGQDGVSKIIENPVRYVSSEVVRANNGFINENLGKGHLAEPYDNALKEGLLGGGKIHTFKSKAVAGKTFTGNYEEFARSFENGGGWKSLLEISKPQNNFWGILNLTLNELGGVEQTAAEIAKVPAGESMANYGFKSDRECAREENGQCVEWKTITPSRTVGDIVEKAVNIDIPWLTEAKDEKEYKSKFDEIINLRTLKDSLMKLTSIVGTGNEAMIDFESIVNETYEKVVQALEQEAESRGPGNYGSGGSGQWGSGFGNSGGGGGGGGGNGGGGDNSTNTPPVFIDFNPPTEAYVNVLYVYTAIASDPEDDNIRFSLLSNPPGMFITSSTGVITWSPLRRHVNNSPHLVEVQITDSRGEKTVAPFSINVHDSSEE